MENAMTIHLNENKFMTPADVHAYLKFILGFPEYYGGNLAALSDCLGDVNTPVKIVVIRSSKPKANYWFDKICNVLQRGADQNPNIEVEIQR